MERGDAILLQDELQVRMKLEDPRHPFRSFGSIHQAKRKVGAFEPRLVVHLSGSLGVCFYPSEARTQNPLGFVETAHGQCFVGDGLKQVKRRTDGRRFIYLGVDILRFQLDGRSATRHRRWLHADDGVAVNTAPTYMIIELTTLPASRELQRGGGVFAGRLKNEQLLRADLNAVEVLQRPAPPHPVAINGNTVSAPEILEL